MNAKLHLNLTVQKHWDITCLFVHFLFLHFSLGPCLFDPMLFFCSMALMAQSFGVFLS